jgi:hypothetical protein
VRPQRRRSKSCSGATEALLTPEFIQHAQQLAKEDNDDEDLVESSIVEDTVDIIKVSSPESISAADGNVVEDNSQQLSIPSIDAAPDDLGKLRTPVMAEEAPAELQKFGIPPGDKLIISYSCALYPKRGMLTHGR